MQYEMEELLPIVAELAAKYTSKESSSVTYEKAEQLMQAVIYTIEELRFSEGDALRTDYSAADAYQMGYEILCRRVIKCQETYNGMIESFDSYGNEFYEDTVVKGLPQFFLYYDVRFCPQDHILTLDYLTRDFDVKLSGIDQITAYLDSIVEEQKFLHRFSRESVLYTLMQWNIDYRELPVNLAQVMQDSLS